GRGLVEEPRPAGAAALLASCRDEACLGKDAKVETDGVQVQTDPRAKLAGIERCFSLLHGFEDPDAAWLAQCTIERRALLRSSSRQSRCTRTSPSGCASSGCARSSTSGCDHCRPGAVTSARSTSTTSTTTSGRPRSKPPPGRTCRRTSSRPGTGSGSPRPSGS